jgi:hypothetical protein
MIFTSSVSARETWICKGRPVWVKPNSRGVAEFRNILGCGNLLLILAKKDRGGRNAALGA